MLRRFAAFSPVMRLIFGSAAGQAVVILVTPILTRVYDPNDFGVLAVVTAIAAMVGAVAGLRLDMAIPIDSDDREAAGAGWASVLACLITAVPFTAVSLLVYGWLANTSRLWTPGILALTASSAFLIGTAAVATRWLGRRRDYRGISGLVTSQGWLQSANQLLLHSMPHGLLVGLPAGRLPSLVFLFWPKAKTRMSWPGWRRTWRALVRFRRFPLISSWGSLINAAGLQMPALLLAGLAGPAAAGTYMIAQRLLAAPTVLVAQAISEVNYSELSYSQRETMDRMAPVLKRTVARLALFSVPLFGCIAIAAPLLMEWALGEAWGEAGVFVSALALGTAAQFIVIPVSRTLLLLERQAMQTVWEVARLAAVACAFLLMDVAGAEPALSLFALSIVQVVAYGSLAFMIIRAASMRDANRLSQTA
jgi:O-antigen/teichoic acid export membrane protein